MNEDGRGFGGHDRRRRLVGLPGGGGHGPDLEATANRDLRTAAALMADAQRIASFGSWEWRLADDSVVWSDQLYRIFNIDPATFTPSIDGYLEQVHPDDRGRVADAIRGSAESGRSFRVEHRVQGRRGARRVVRCQGEPLRGAGSEPDRVIGVCQDVTELAEAEQARGAADARFRSAFENAPIGVALVEFDTGPDGRLVDVNNALCELLGRSKRDLIGSALSALALPEEREDTVRMHQRLIAGELDRIEVERRCEASDGRVIWTLVHLSVVRGGDGTATGVAQIQDISGRKEFEEQLRHVADHDSLTGLLNRRRFSEELSSQLAQKRRYGGTAAALVVDVDNLKLINDSHGHSAGDEALRSVADALSHRLRSTDVVARLGGDEFGLLLPNADFQEADGLAAALLARLAQQEVFGVPVTVSIGVCVFDGSNWASPEEVIADADSAMYRAKQSGGGSYQRAYPPTGARSEQDHDPQPPRLRAITSQPQPAPRPGGKPSARPQEAPPSSRSEDAGERARVIRQLVVEAVRGDGLLMYAQPVFDLRTGEVAHNELLVRMRDETSAVLSASDFLGIAAQDPGLCTQVDLWVVRTALRALTTGRLGGRLQVNLSGETLANAAALRQIVAEVSESGLPLGSLAFEVAEASIDRDVEAAIEGLTMLSEAGCPIVLDGFSAGFGSLEYLQRLPLEQIKIDGAIVRELEREAGDHATLRAIVKLARGSHRTTVAKLVGSDSVLPLLRMHGVDMAQGFGLGEPEPIG